jgi:hypothetical protein
MLRRLFSLAVPGALAAPAAAPPNRPAPARRLPATASDPDLGRFNPLPRILCYDDFDRGVNGWAELQANHNGNLDMLRPVMRDMRPPQLSSCDFFDIGTHGSMSGTYALKLATRPRPFSTAAAIKRLTYAKPSLVQFEMYFTYKAEQVFSGAAFDGNASPSELDFGDFTISNDVNAGPDGPRYHCALRYANTDASGKLAQKWLYKTSLHTTTKMELAGFRAQTEDYHVRSVDDWAEIPGGRQPLCYNEVPTKINWHYLRWVVDTRTRRNIELQSNELTLDLRSIPVPTYEQKYHALNHLLNFVLDVRTRKAVRNFLYVDSILISLDV